MQQCATMQCIFVQPNVISWYAFQQQCNVPLYNHCNVFLCKEFLYRVRAFLLWDVYLSFEIPDHCHSHSIVNGTRCCAFLYDECVHAEETQFNCTAAPQNSLPYGGNLLNLTMSKCGLNGNIPTNITLLPLPGLAILKRKHMVNIKRRLALKKKNMEK